MSALLSPVALVTVLAQVPTDTLSIDINSYIGYLYQGANIMFQALAGPYLLIAGFSLGLFILGAIASAVRFRR